MQVVVRRRTRGATGSAAAPLQSCSHTCPLLPGSAREQGPRCRSTPWDVLGDRGCRVVAAERRPDGRRATLGRCSTLADLVPALRPVERMTGSASDRAATEDGAPGGGQRRGVALIAGGLVLLLLVRPVGPLDVRWIPLLVGLAFVAAAAVTGQRSPLWGPGLVVSAYGTAEVVNLFTDVSGAGAWTLVAIGLGGLLAAHLGRRGWAMSAASVASPVVFIGIGQWIAGTTPGATITWSSAGVTVLYGLAELVGSRRGDRPVGAR